MSSKEMKKTEIGLIPEDWEVKTLSELGIFSKGKGISKSKANSGEIPAIRYGEIYTKHNDIIRCYYSFVDIETAKNSKLLKKGDLLFASSGETKEDIGKTVAFTSDENVYAGGDIVILSIANQNSAFLGYLLNSSAIQKQKAEKAQGDAVVHIYANSLKEIKIALPPPSEQLAITNALSDADSLIESLEKLIVKKQLIKQGAMQMLLIPKKDWEEKELGKAAIITMGQSPLSRYYNQMQKGLPLIQGNADIEKRKTIVRNYTSQFTKVGEPNDIIMSVRAPVGEIAKTDFKCCLGRGVCSIKYPNDFIYHLLVSKENAWSEFSSGSTFDSINSEQIKKFKISLPKSKTEQVRIATIYQI